MDWQAVFEKSISEHVLPFTAQHSLQHLFINHLLIRIILIYYLYCTLFMLIYIEIVYNIHIEAFIYSRLFITFSSVCFSFSVLFVNSVVRHCGFFFLISSVPYCSAHRTNYRVLVDEIIRVPSIY